MCILNMAIVSNNEVSVCATSSFWLFFYSWFILTSKVRADIPKTIVSGTLLRFQTFSLRGAAISSKLAYTEQVDEQKGSPA